MSSSQILLIVDDIDLNATYGGGQWGTSSFYPWYGGSITWPQFAASNTANLTGSISLSFEGVAIAFSGLTHTVFRDSQTLAVSIDGAPPYNTSYDDPATQSYVQWYQSPTLADGTHNITLTHIAGTALDYAVITAGQHTSLLGRKIVVDNEDASIGFTGSWKRNTDRFHSGSPPDGYPFHNSTHQSSTPGDTFIFRFSGTSLNIYGIMNWANVGTVSAMYTLDGEATLQNYSVTTSSPMFQNNAIEQHNFLLFSTASLAAGNHTLVVKVTNCANQIFIFDYLTYQPSFSTLATMSDLPLPASSSSINGAPHTATNSIHVGPVIGGVLGGLALLFLLIGGFLWFRKNKSQEDHKEENQITAFPVPSNGPEILGPPGAVHKSPRHVGVREMAPTPPTTVGHINPIEGGRITTEGPPREIDRSSRSVAAREMGPTSTAVAHTEGGPITTEMREAAPSIAPPAYADLLHPQRENLDRGTGASEVVERSVNVESLGNHSF